MPAERHDSVAPGREGAKRHTGAKYSAYARHALAALVTTALIRFSLPPYDVWLLTFLCWTPLLILVGKTPTRMLLAWTLCSGILLNLIVHWWVVPALMQVAAIPILPSLGALAALSVVQGTRMPIIMLIVALGARWRWPIWLSFPLATVIVERIHPHLFPWTMALGVHSVPTWLQAASLGGASAVSLWLALVNGLLARAWQCRGSKQRVVRCCTAAGCIILAASLAGTWAIDARTAGETMAGVGHVAIGHAVTNGDESPRETVPELRRSTLAVLDRVANIDFALWPETTVQVPTLDGLPRLSRDYLFRDRAQGARAPRIDVPLLVGAVVDDAGKLYNSALLVRPSGVLVGRYDKRSLVPVGESTELGSWLPSLSAVVPAVTSFAVGGLRKPIVINERKLALSICYEDILDEPFRATVLRTQPNLLVNLTSDAWFADTDAKDFHFALAKLRSVEHGRYMVRATRDGVSGVIDSAGRVHLRIDAPTSEVHYAEIRWLAGLTPYTKHGDAWLWLLGAVALLAASLQSVRTRSRDSRKDLPER